MDLDFLVDRADLEKIDEILKDRVEDVIGLKIQAMADKLKAREWQD